MFVCLSWSTRQTSYLQTAYSIRICLWAICGMTITVFPTANDWCVCVCVQRLSSNLLLPRTQPHICQARLPVCSTLPVKRTWHRSLPAWRNMCWAQTRFHRLRSSQFTVSKLSDTEFINYLLNNAILFYWFYWFACITSKMFWTKGTDAYESIAFKSEYIGCVICLRWLHTKTIQ